MGLADIITRRAYDKIDFQSTYANVLTTGFLERAKVPVVAATDREAVELACRSAGVRGEQDVRLIRIRNTLRLDELQVSAAVLEEIKDHAGVTLLGEITPVWDRNGGMGECSA
jgi:hypothetical protein